MNDPAVAFDPRGRSGRCAACRGRPPRLRGGAILAAGMLVVGAALSVKSVPAGAADALSSVKEPSTACRYGGIRAHCGELVVRVRTGGGTFPAAASAVSKAVEREGGVVVTSDSDLGYVIASFPRFVDLPAVKSLLEAESSVQWVAYSPIVQHD